MNQKKLIGELCMWMLKILTYFDIFAFDNIQKKKKKKKFIENKNIRTIIYRMQAYKSTMCAYLSIRFIGFMLKV